MEQRPDDRPDQRDEPDQPDEPGGNADLLSIGLVVFFVALIGTVAALLLAPALF